MDTDLSQIRSQQVAAAARVVADAAHHGEMSHSIHLIVSRLRDILRCDGGMVELERDDSLIACYASGHSRRWRGRSRHAESSLGGPCFVTDELLVTADVTRDRRFADRAASEPEVRSMIAVPLHLMGPPIGVVRVVSGINGFFSRDDVLTARLVTGGIQRILLHGLREERDAQGLPTRVIAEGLWALRDRRKSQLRRSGDRGYDVSLVICEIKGYLTSEILGHVSMLVRETDQCFRQDAGTYAIVMPGTTYEEAQTAARRIKRELEAFVRAADDEITVDCEVRRLASSNQQEAKTA